VKGAVPSRALSAPSSSAALLCALALVACGSGSTPRLPRPGGAAHNATMTGDDTVATRGKDVVEKLASGAHGEVYGWFDEAMRAAMTEEALAELWPSVVARVGPFQAIQGVQAGRHDRFDIVTVTCAFDKALLDVRVVLDDKGRVSGLFFLDPAAKAAYRPPPYADPAAIEEIELSVGEGDFALPATLTLRKAMVDANGRCTGLVLVHGSGPNDRDETVGPNKPFRDLAHGLGARGVCVLRYEKRTRHYPKLVVERFGDALTVKEETIDDAIAATHLLRQQPAVDPERVFVLGHSLGGWAIPRIAKEGPDLRGFVIMAGSTRALEDIVLEQITYVSDLDGRRSKEERATLDKLEAQVARVKALTPESKVDKRDLPLGVPAPYWLDLRAHDPTKLVADEARPLLVLHGGRDYQVTDADFAGWQRALGGRQNATLKRYPALNHLFIAGTGKSAPTEYAAPGNVAVEVVDDIAAWLLAN
jgi:hypothetical protein